MEQTRKIVLASSSAYRRLLLEKIVTNFEAGSPQIDESAIADEEPRQLSARLAVEKAQALASTYSNHLIIGSDQVAMLGELQLHKPGNRVNCIEQLAGAAGNSVIFYTSVCIYDSGCQRTFQALDVCTVYFRPLSRAQIERYVDTEKPFDCAGGFKSEGLGIVLFERIEGDDPNALIGLPLIKLNQLFEQAGQPLL